ncbi:MAG: glycosidase [Candidatus Neomarinimicrobiota bacterium]
MTRYRRRGRDILHRWEGNPVLTLEDMPFPCNSVFNGTPVKLNGEYLLLLRVEGQRGYSFFALARSEDGFHFEVERKPVLFPAEKGLFNFYENRGIEDPRATFIDGAFHILYTAVSEVGYRIALARTEDFRSFERIALVSEPGNKDGVLFPEKIAGRYVRLDRPIGLGVGSIWISYSNDLKSWGDSTVLLTPRWGYWDSFRVGASVPPICTERGWLEIYHGTKMTSAGPIYRAGAALLDLKDPSRVLKRCDVPILTPREEYERIGDVGNVVFPCGAIVEPDGEIKVYYGAADTSLAVATARLADLVDCLNDQEVE